MPSNIASALSAALLLSAVSAGAQDVDSLSAQYGRGVHAYFAGDYVGPALAGSQSAAPTQSTTLSLFVKPPVVGP